MNTLITGPNKVLFGEITSFEEQHIIRKKGNAKTKHNLIGTKITLVVTLKRKVDPALHKLRNTFGQHNVQKIGGNVLRITLFIRGRLFDRDDYFEKRRVQIQNALCSQRYPKRKKPQHKIRPSQNVPALIAAVAHAY